MATRKPLVVVDGRLSELPAGDSLDGVAGGGGGSGDVVGPAASTPGHLPVFADSSGKVLQDATYFDTPAISIPTPPADGDMRWFARSMAGRMLPHIVGPLGIDIALQPALFGNSVYMWLPGTGTTLSVNFGCSWTARNSGTSAAQAHPARSATNAMTSLNRATFGTGTSATGTSGVQSASTVAWRGNAAGLGGFFFFARFGVETLASDMRAFVGLSANNAAMAADASTWANTVGLAKDSADSTWQIVCRSSSALTKTPTGITVTAGQVLDLAMFAAPNGSSVTVRISNGVTGEPLLENTVLTSNLPASTAFMYAWAACQSVTGTTAKLLALNRIYCENDL